MESNEQKLLVTREFFAFPELLPQIPQQSALPYVQWQQGRTRHVRSSMSPREDGFQGVCQLTISLFNWSSHPQKLVPEVILAKASLSLGTQLGSCEQPFNFPRDYREGNDGLQREEINKQRKQSCKAERESAGVHFRQGDIPPYEACLYSYHLCLFYAYARITSFLSLGIKVAQLVYHSSA